MLNLSLVLIVLCSLSAWCTNCWERQSLTGLELDQLYSSRLSAGQFYDKYKTSSNLDRTFFLLLIRTISDGHNWTKLTPPNFFLIIEACLECLRFFSGLVIDDGRIFLVRLGCQVGKVTAPRRRRQPHPTRTCSYFAYDKVLGLPKFSYRQSLAYGHRRARDRSTKVVRLGWFRVGYAYCNRDVTNFNF